MKRERKVKGRGASSNPRNRFEALEVEWEDEEVIGEDERPSPRTQFLDDHSRSIISYNDSPDLPFGASVNPYRGCEHGCAYCYARPTHEYLGFSSGLDFETKIMVKRSAPELLREELASPKWKPQLIAMSGVTDCYQPVERQLKLTRRCLEVLRECRNPVGIVTKNRLVTRDLDILRDMAKERLCQVFLSINSLDTDLARRLEPRTSSPRDRLRAMEALAAAGVPTGVLVAPVIPGLNDHEIAQVLKASYSAGASFAGYVLLRLPYQNKELFLNWVRENGPGKAKRIEDRLRAMRQGELNSSSFGSRMRGEGIYAEQIGQLFRLSARKLGLDKDIPPLDTSKFRRPRTDQLELEL